MSKTSNEYKKDIRRRKRMRSLVINSLAIVGAFAVFSLLSFAGKKQNNTICWKMEVSILDSGDKKFLSEETITKMAMAATDSIIGKRAKDIDIGAIHKKLAGNSSVKEARVFTTVDGRCIIQVKQRTPIARIINADGSSFYLDKDGFTMALSTQYTAKVPVFTGTLHESLSQQSILDYEEGDDFLKTSLLDDIYRLTWFIRGNEFWNAQVEHVYVNSKKEFEIIPRVGNHRIQIGDADNLEEKFRKLMVFYANTLHTTDLNQYSAINVEYDGQVVCVKRGY